jgi:hypothetical protein
VERAKSPAEELRGVLGILRGEHLDVGQAGVVVYADEDHLPADAALLAAPLAVDPVPDAVRASFLASMWKGSPGAWCS